MSEATERAVWNNGLIDDKKNMTHDAYPNQLQTLEIKIRMQDLLHVSYSLIVPQKLIGLNCEQQIVRG